MPVRWGTHHGTGGSRIAWEQGLPGHGSVREMGMQAGRVQHQGAPRTGLPPGGWAGVTTGLTGAAGGVVRAARQGQQQARSRQQRQRQQPRTFVGQQPQQPQVQTTTNVALEAGPPSPWGASFDNGTAPGVTSISDINSRMQAFATPRPTPPPVPVAVRGLPIRPPSSTAT